MGTFYDNWLELWDRAEAERQQARKVIHEEDIEWVETRQDAKAGLLIAPETGFRTWGTVTMIAEVPAGYHTGEHKRGEEVIHIVGGEGFSVIDGLRYDWAEGSTLLIPFGARRQHFNTGDTQARYIASLSVHLEHYCGLHRTVQYSDQGKTTRLPDAQPSPQGDYDPEGERVVCRLEDAIQVIKEKPKAEDIPQIDPDKPMVLGDISGMAKMSGVHKDQVWRMMRIGKDINGFHPKTMEMSSILQDAPHTAGGTHSHMEAHLYITAGKGHTNVDDVPVEWKKGSALHITGPQTKHQHVNDGDEPSKMIRIAPGIRYFWEAAAQREFPYLYNKISDAAAQSR